MCFKGCGFGETACSCRQGLDLFTFWVSQQLISPTVTYTKICSQSTMMWYVCDDVGSLICEYKQHTFQPWYNWNNWPTASDSKRLQEIWTFQWNLSNPMPENGIGNLWVTALIKKKKKKNHVIIAKYMCSQAKNIFLFYPTILPYLYIYIFIEQMEVTACFSVIISTE